MTSVHWIFREWRLSSWSKLKQEVTRAPSCRSVLPGFSELRLKHGLGGVFLAVQPIVGGPDGMKAAPVSFAQNPGQDVHLIMKLWGKLSADQIRRSCSLSSSDQPHPVVVATVLRRQCGAVVREHGAEAEPGRKLVDVQPLFGSAGISPAVGPLKLLVWDVDGAVHGLRRVGAGAAGELGAHLVQVPLQEVILAAEPLLTAVHI